MAKFVFYESTCNKKTQLPGIRPNCMFREKFPFIIFDNFKDLNQQDFSNTFLLNNHYIK